MRRFLAGVIVGFMLSGSVAYAAAGYNGFPTMRLFLDGKELISDVPAIVMNNRTLVPVRVVAEALGAQVSVNQTGDAVLLTTGNAQAQQPAPPGFEFLSKPMPSGPLRGELIASHANPKVQSQTVTADGAFTVESVEFRESGMEGKPLVVVNMLWANNGTTDIQIDWFRMIAPRFQTSGMELVSSSPSVTFPLRLKAGASGTVSFTFRPIRSTAGYARDWWLRITGSPAFDTTIIVPSPYATP